MPPTKAPTSPTASRAVAAVDIASPNSVVDSLATRLTSTKLIESVPTATLLQLDDDSLDLILLSIRQLPVSDICRVASTCKRLHDALAADLTVSRQEARHGLLSKLKSRGDFELETIIMGTDDAADAERESLSLSDMWLTDRDALVLMSCLRPRSFPRVVELALNNNFMTDVALKVLAGTFASRSWGWSLQALFLGGNEGITDAGVGALARATRKAGVLPKLECLGLENTFMGPEGIRSLAGALADGKLPNLRILYAFPDQRSMPAQAQRTNEQQEACDQLHEACIPRGVSTPGF